jgi:hypothetical protein
MHWMAIVRQKIGLKWQSIALHVFRDEGSRRNMWNTTAVEQLGKELFAPTHLFDFIPVCEDYEYTSEDVDYLFRAASQPRASH